MTSSLVLLSGGLDSTTALYHTDARHAVWVDYGQRHRVERRAAEAVAAATGTTLYPLDLTGFGASVSSALTSPGTSVPHGHYAADTMSQTVVPNRNATLLSAAAGIAASQGLDRVVTAVHAGDHPIYQDCRPEFIEALSEATQLGCGVAVEAPFVHQTKDWIVSRGHELGVPYHLTWSCYEGGERHCGRCGTCVERAESFMLAGVPDPTEYADATYWREAVGAGR